MFLVRHGEVVVCRDDDAGARRKLVRMGAGEFFGEMSLMTGAPRSATVTAFTEVHLLEVDKESFRRLLEAQPTLVEKLGEALAARLEERSRSIARTGPAQEPPPPDLFQRIKDFFAM